MTDSFPVDLSRFRPLLLKPDAKTLTGSEMETLHTNIQLCREAIVFFTSLGAAKGLGGHSGGAYDVVPEALIAHGFMRNSREGNGPSIFPVLFDEAGHRVALHYLLAVLDGTLAVESLLHYREYDCAMPGHPERDQTPGVLFSSGRLGHMWPFVNGVAMANPDDVILVLGSDGSQMEGGNAEAARLAVAQSLRVKLLIDDNDITIGGNPSDYLPGYDVAKTLEGHGLSCAISDGEDLNDLFTKMGAAVLADGPSALMIRRTICPGFLAVEGKAAAHGPISPTDAIPYLRQRNQERAAVFLENATKLGGGASCRGSSGKGVNRNVFGECVNEILDTMTPEERVASVKVFDSDLEGSCGLGLIHKAHPEVFVPGGIMERGNFSAAAGFGYTEGKQGIFATFSAFLEMVISELTMARLNKANILAHFSHSGCDDMADNSCHFGLNSFFADNGLPDDDQTRLYFPADQGQFRSCVKTIFSDPGARFIFSTRSAVPDILTEEGTLFFDEGYSFTPGKDDLIRAGSAGYIVSYGETLYRALDATLTLKEEGIDIGLVNKATLNVYDDEMMARLATAPFILVAEALNVKTGLGCRFGSELLKRGFRGAYNNIGIYREGCGGLWQQMGYQGLDPAGIAASVRTGIITGAPLGVSK